MRFLKMSLSDKEVEDWLNTYYKLPKIEHLKFTKLLWAYDWYDGPLSGIALYNGLLCFFHLLERVNEDKYDNYYGLNKLTKEEIAIEVGSYYYSRKNDNGYWDLSIEDEYMDKLMEWFEVPNNLNEEEASIYTQETERWTTTDLYGYGYRGNPIIGWIKESELP